MTAKGASARRRASAALGAALALVVVAGCVADPPPPTVVGDDRTDGTTVSLTDGGILLALDRVVAHELQVAADHGDGGAQLVPGVVDELALGGEGLRQPVQHAVEGAPEVGPVSYTHLTLPTKA